MKRRLLEGEGKADTEHSVGLLFPGGHSSEAHGAPRCLPLKDGRPGASSVERYPRHATPPTLAGCTCFGADLPALTGEKAKPNNKQKPQECEETCQSSCAEIGGWQGRGTPLLQGARGWLRHIGGGWRRASRHLSSLCFWPLSANRAAQNQIQGHSLNIPRAGDNAMLTSSCSSKSTEL